MKFKITNYIEDSLNGGAMDCKINDTILDFMCHAHRSLQSRLMKWIVVYISINAKHYKENPTRWFDGRNDWCGELCSKIVENHEFYHKSLLDDMHQQAAERLSKMRDIQYESCKD